MKYLIVLCLFLISCVSTKYIEKQSIPLKQAVYATGDSVLAGRFDLAEFYIFETEKLVSPPEEKDRIKIEAIIVP